ncbi:MAG: MBG domain-containing protein, partial [bacterium]|nr:MBG domain-containing protein [bacterium]
TLTVTRRVLTVKADDVTKAYGDAVTLAAYTVTGLQNDDKVEAVTLASDGAAATAPYRAEGYEITLSNVQGMGLENYEIAPQPGMLTVTKRMLTVKADDVTKVYGDAVTLAAYTVIGLQNDDKVESVTLESDGAAATAPYRTEGYPITLSNPQGTGLENYQVSTENGTLTVTKRMLGIAARNMQKPYGEKLDFVGDEFLVTSGTLASGDTVDAVTLVSDGAEAQAAYKAEGYPITASAAQGRGLANYEIAYADGTLSVTKRPLTITANDASKVYGEAVDFTGTEFTLTSGTLAAGDAVDSVTLASDGAPAAAPWREGGYPITASAAQGTGLANYEIAYADGTLSVTKRPLTITANDASKVYGEAVDFTGTEFTLTSGTLAAGDAVDSVTLASDGAAATAAYRAEGYPITASAAQGTGLANYEIAYADGTLSVTKRPLTITANDASKVYGEAVDFTGTEFTLTSGTLAAGDAVDSVTLASDGAAAAAAYKAEGYPITASAAQGTGLANYEITYADGTLSVTKRALEITARNMQKPYGETLDFVGDEFLITSGTLAAGDTLDSVTLASDGAPAAAPWRAVGYEIKVTDVQGTGLENYDITRKNGTLTITKRALMITANDATKAYGETLTFEGTEFTVSGDLQNGERVETVTLTSEKATEPGTEVGEYAEAIVPGHVVTGIDTNNYDIAFANGTLTVTQAVLTITVNDAKWRVGRPRPAYSFADFSAQLQADDTVADVTGGAGLATDVVYTNAVWNATEPTDTDEGTYEDEIWLDPASLVGARAANYVIAIEPGDLVVRSAEAELETAVSATLNWNTGLLDLELTIRNKGDGEVDPDFDYWVELKAGASANGAVASVEKSFYLDSPTGTMPDGYDYMDLTAQVKAALKSVGNGDAVFDPGEAVTVKGVSVYHWKRWSPEKFIDVNTFFVAGRLFNPADTDRNFIVSEAEKAAAAALLGTSSADYLEVSRLALLPYYHWKSADGTWK